MVGILCRLSANESFALKRNNLSTIKIINAEIDPDLVRDSLSRVLSSKRFETSPSIKRRVAFVVEARLTGQSQLKSYTLGVEVFNRSSTHDPQTDSIVRTTSVRLRKLLDAYYAEEGRDEHIRLLLNKGSYLPVFALESSQGIRPERRCKHILLVVEQLKLMGGAPEMKYISIGLSEELISSLSGYSENFIAVHADDVIDPQTCNSISLSIPDSICYLLRGRIRVDNDEIRINFKLSECKTGMIKWCEDISARLSPSILFDILKEVACKVASTLLDPHGIIYRSLKRKPAEQLGTYLAVFRYHEYQERFTPDTHLKARESLETAVLNEPDYADAWASLANVYLGEALFGFNQTSNLTSLVEKCLEAARKAVALEPRNVMANYIHAMALFYRKDKAQFLAMAEHTLKLAPFRPDNLAVIGMHLMMAGEWERGLGLVEKAMELNPYHPNWHYLVLSLYHLHGRDYLAALNSVSRFAVLDFFPFQVNLAVIHGYLGYEREARKHLERMFELWPGARQNMEEILEFWFPFEDLAEIFTESLRKAGVLTAN